MFGNKRIRINWFLFIIILFICTTFYACKSSKNAVSGSTSHSAKAEVKKREAQVNKAIEIAFSFQGVPYKTGGMDKTGMDCSGLVNVSYKEAGVILPRSTAELSKIGKDIELKEVEKGDLLFFATKKNSSDINHVGLVTKVLDPANILFIHASTKLGVVEDNLSTKYYKEAFIKAVRPY